jgi:mitochondrial fission protein ELM1
MPTAAGAETPPVVWLLDDRTHPDAPSCLAIAERLGLEFRRIALDWTLAARAPTFLSRDQAAGSVKGLRAPLPLTAGPPALTLSAGPRAAFVAAWLRRVCGSKMVHYGETGRGARADLAILDAPCSSIPGALTVLGAPQRLGPVSLQSARAFWQERLNHLPKPLLALVVGSGPFGAALQPCETLRLAAGLAEALQGARGAVVTTVDRRAGRKATDALGSGLSRCLHLLHREGEPGPDPELGFLALADVVVVAGHAGPRLLRACSVSAPVYVTSAGPLQPAEHRMQRRLQEAGHVRALAGELGGWTRQPLDEAGRAACAVHALLDVR